MEEKLIIRLSNNLGNQMFMFAAGYATSKLMNRNFYIDNLSSYKSRKNIYTYALNGFKIPSNITTSQDIFVKFNGYIRRKFKKKIDPFLKKKSFILEKYYNDKETKFTKININQPYNKTVYMEGYFESEKYFSDYKKDLIDIFTPKKKSTFQNNKYYHDIVSQESVSFCLRQDRFSEKYRNISNLDRDKSRIFLEEQVLFIFNAIEYFKKKLKSPSFYLWSNNFKNLKNIFKNHNVTFVDNYNTSNNIDKMHLDLYLMTNCKHFAVIPSAFNWWGAWLSNNSNKLIVRPNNNYFKHLKIKNEDYWPIDWISL
tara:strand:- start:1168 stop:2103 length:936 start_codon:yes stop_codon:yes gene_type:complete